MSLKRLYAYFAWLYARNLRSDVSSAVTPMSVNAARRATTTASFLAARSADRHREPPSLILQPTTASDVLLANRKREHLINQIKEQAAQISELMSKLEEANRIASSRVSVSAPVDPKPIPDICDEGAAAVLAAEDLTGSVPVPCPPTEGAVADWITNARRSPSHVHDPSPSFGSL